MAASVSIDKVQDDCIKHLLANMPEGFTEEYNLKLPNLEMPNGTPNDKWLRVTFLGPVPIDSDASGCYKEYNGFFVVDVFYAKGTFPKLKLKTAQEISDSFFKKSFDYSFTVNCDILVLGETNNWDQAQVVITYQYGSYSGE